ncbi:hypothetical protein DLAC_11780 [Tieghemostelium lacteum]|uniref:Deacetylase sirtuin-type domain-containing protein n=1 Tax=Tieghemostelium lacteum TaxID=361077 RepID=A0A151Z6L5_TIELA|nr:hypothetical protein DLAC_11780 [Tieghemostelium lacteum]|eukprot:KYQ89603.1 hypothetical protein DLAC_11780 [Tieghemostelium lacteum]
MTEASDLLFDKINIDDIQIEEDKDSEQHYYDRNRKEIESLALELLNGKNVLFVTGAGLSVPSGISAYRGKDSIWSKFILDWGTREKFIQDPFAFYNTFWLQSHEKRNFLEAQPNLGHYAISSIVECCNVNVITQNIDCLHIKSKVPLEKLIEIHGRISLYKCINNKCPYSWSKTIDTINIDDYNIGGTSIWKDNLIINPPLCPNTHCNRPVLPQSLLFDEQYASHSFYRYDEALKWIQAAEVVVFVGTSFSVGITDTILKSSKKKKLYNFNLYKEKNLGVPINSIVGPSEVTLPLLERELITQTIKKTGKYQIWYKNTIKRLVSENAPLKIPFSSVV